MLSESSKHNQSPAGKRGLGDLSAVLTPRMIRTCAAVWLERKTHQQAAALHGVTRAAICKRLQRARQRLKACGLPVPRPGPARMVKAVAGLESV